MYVHCTAGLGRAPAVCIAYMYWFTGLSLEEAYGRLTSVRPCGPKRDAIRGATHDLLSPEGPDAFARQPAHAWTDLDAADRFAVQFKVLKGVF